MSQHSEYDMTKSGDEEKKSLKMLLNGIEDDDTEKGSVREMWMMDGLNPEILYKFQPQLKKSEETSDIFNLKWFFSQTV